SGVAPTQLTPVTPATVEVVDPRVDVSPDPAAQAPALRVTTTTTPPDDVASSSSSQADHGPDKDPPGQAPRTTTTTTTTTTTPTAPTTTKPGNGKGRDNGNGNSSPNSP
ncbi:MAG: hypothetical protein QOG30_1494, partial [Acidimicrobiaceae bacterium]